jgi:hypothetical protein
MSNQIRFFPAEPAPTNKERRNWENAFQKWSNEQFHEGRVAYGACGYSSICNYCEDMSYGRPCVRALNAMCKDKNITIDYSNRNFEEVWNM